MAVMQVEKLREALTREKNSWIKEEFKRSKHPLVDLIKEQISAISHQSSRIEKISLPFFAINAEGIREFEDGFSTVESIREPMRNFQIEEIASFTKKLAFNFDKKSIHYIAKKETELPKKLVTPRQASPPQLHANNHSFIYGKFTEKVVNQRRYQRSDAFVSEATGATASRNYDWFSDNKDAIDKMRLELREHLSGRAIMQESRKSLAEVKDYDTVPEILMHNLKKINRMSHNLAAIKNDHIVKDLLRMLKLSGLEVSDKGGFHSGR